MNICVTLLNGRDRAGKVVRIARGVYAEVAPNQLFRIELMRFQELEAAADSLVEDRSRATL